MTENIVTSDVLTAGSPSRNITSEGSKLLLCSSHSSISALGAPVVTPSLMGEEKEYPDDTWHYLFLRNRDLKHYIDLFSGRIAYKFRRPDGSEAESRYHYKIFSYTTADHKRRFERCGYTKSEYEARVESSQAVKSAFATGDADRLNALIDTSTIVGDGYLFICAPQKALQQILAKQLPPQYLVTNYKTHQPVAISSREMEEFIYLYESMPYNIELMERPLEDYQLKQQRIRITSGLFKGKEGVLMRLHRNSRLVFAFGNMTIAISYIHAFPYERIE